VPLVHSLVQRAATLFSLEEWTTSSPFVARIWRTRSEPEPNFISVAASHWEIVVTTHRGVARLTIRGPETRATTVPIPQDAEFFGIDFSLGTFMPDLPPAGLVDRALTLPPAAPTSAWFGRTRWEVPTPETVDGFVARLVRDGVLIHDPLVAAALRGEANGRAPRTLERRVARATGLTRGTIRQIGRAGRAVEVLARGATPADAARHTGYADQAHLTRSLKRFVGQTPAQIAGSARAG